MLSFKIDEQILCDTVKKIMDTYFSLIKLIKIKVDDEEEAPITDI